MERISEPVKICTVPINIHEVCISSGQIVCRRPGPSIDIIRIAMKMLNLSHEFRIPRDNLWGSEQSDGSWNGIVGEIMNGTCDVCSPYIYPNEDRRKVLDMIPIQVMDTYTTFLFHPKALTLKNRFTWWNAFDWKLWITFGACMILSNAFDIAMTERRHGKQWTILNQIFTASTVFCSVLFQTLLLKFLVHKEDVPFRTLDEATNNVRNGIFEFASLAGSVYELSVKNDPLFAEIKPLVSAEKFWFNYMKDAIFRIYSSPRTFFLGSDYDCEMAKSMEAKLVCYKLARNLFLPSYTTSMLPYNSPLKELLKSSYQYMQDLGILMLVKRRYTVSTVGHGVFVEDSASTMDPITFNHVALILYYYAAAIVLLIMVFLIERRAEAFAKGCKGKAALRLRREHDNSG